MVKSKFDYKKTDKYKSILQRELDQYILQVLNEDQMNDVRNGKMRPDAYYDNKRNKLIKIFETDVEGRDGIMQPSELRARIEDMADNVYLGVKNAKKKATQAMKSQGQRLNEPEIVETKPKQGVFSTLTQMALRAGRTFLPKQRRDRAKVYVDMSGVNM